MQRIIARAVLKKRSDCYLMAANCLAGSWDNEVKVQIAASEGKNGAIGDCSGLRYVFNCSECGLYLCELPTESICRIRKQS